MAQRNVEPKGVKPLIFDTGRHDENKKEPDQPHRDKTVTKTRWLLPILFSALSLLCVGAFIWTQMTAEVPIIVGHELEEAKHLLEEKGFGMEVSQEAYSDAVGRGYILSQEESGGRKLKGSVVHVALSMGGEVVTLPNVSDDPAKAEEELRALGLAVEMVHEDCNVTPIGQVIRQEPKGGTLVSAKSCVTLYVSDGVVVPQLYKLTAEDAQKQTENSGLIFVVAGEEYSDKIGKGKVMRQMVAHDTRVEGGTELPVIVSKGKLVAVPDLIGKSKDEAEKLLLAAGFEVQNGYSTTENPSEDGKVITTEPEAKEMVKEGSEVTIYVGEYCHVIEIILPENRSKTCLVEIWVNGERHSADAVEPDITSYGLLYHGNIESVRATLDGEEAEVEVS